MSNKDIPSLATLPIELIYCILDKLDILTILISFRNVCRRLNNIIDNYHRYKVSFISWAAQSQCFRGSNNFLSLLQIFLKKQLYVLICWSTTQVRMNSKVTLKLSTKSRQLGEVVSFYCFHDFVLGEAIASPRM